MRKLREQHPQIIITLLISQHIKHHLSSFPSTPSSYPYSLSITTGSSSISISPSSIQFPGDILYPFRLFSDLDYSSCSSSICWFQEIPYIRNLQKKPQKLRCSRSSEHRDNSEMMMEIQCSSNYSFLNISTNLSFATVSGPFLIFSKAT